MNDHTDFELPPLASHAPPESNSDADESLDERMRRLENAIAALQDTRLMEHRVLQHVSQRLEHLQSTAGTPGEANALLEAGKTLLPSMMRAAGAQLDAATSPTAQTSGSGSLFSARTWIVTDIIQEVRTFFVMYFDYRYKPSWAARIIPPAALVTFLVSWLVLRSMVFAFVGPLIDYTIDFFLVILVYKTLQREAARYRAHVAYLPPI